MKRPLYGGGVILRNQGQARKGVGTGCLEIGMEVCGRGGEDSRWGGLGSLVRGTELGLKIWGPLERWVKGGYLPGYGSRK